MKFGFIKWTRWGLGGGTAGAASRSCCDRQTNIGMTVIKEEAVAFVERRWKNYVYLSGREKKRARGGNGRERTKALMQADGLVILDGPPSAPIDAWATDGWLGGGWMDMLDGWLDGWMGVIVSILFTRL